MLLAIMSSLHQLTSVTALVRIDRCLHHACMHVFVGVPVIILPLSGAALCIFEKYFVQTAIDLMCPCVTLET
jgi:hypothetical protein